MNSVFIEEIAGYVQEIAPKYGIKVVSPIVAQAIKESAWGTSELAVSAKNLFGIKLKKLPNGESRTPIAVAGYDKASHEFVSGINVVQTSTFALFRSWMDSVEGYCQFITSSMAYSKLIGLTDPEAYCTELQNAGYATAPNYATSLITDYINKYGLKKYDKGEDNMGFTNSGLVSYKQISPCKDENRKYAIDTIIIHCYVGQVSVERMGKGWSKLSANASANYGIGSDGRIGLFVDEKDRAWTTGGKYKVNGWTGSQYDQRAVTIECACDSTAPYAINDAVLQSLIKLCADICRRNGMLTLKWKGDKTLVGKADEQNMVVHRWFTPKACPGDYIYNRLSYIAVEVNKLLASDGTTNTAEKATVSSELPTFIYHTVVKGETLSKIATAYGTTPAIIKYYNTDKIQDINKISVGITLKIPSTLSQMPTTYTVVSGESLSKIASKLTKSGYSITWQTLAKLNGISWPYPITPGQVLKLK